MLDAISSFLETDDDLQPILCGYFNKIVNFMLNKTKHEVLEYLLLKRGGQIFDNLLRHIKYHSLALLMIELLAIQITANLDKKKFEVGGMDNDDRSLDENEPELSKDQLTMQTILHEKKMMVIKTLLDRLSNKN